MGAAQSAEIQIQLVDLLGSSVSREADVSENWFSKKFNRQPALTLPSFDNDLRIAYDFMAFMTNLNSCYGKYSFLQPAMSQVELNQVVSDKRASRNFLNMFENLKLNLRNRINGFNTLENAMNHVIFMDPITVIGLICGIVEGPPLEINVDRHYRYFVYERNIQDWLVELQNNKDDFEVRPKKPYGYATDPSVPDHGYNWRSRLTPAVKKLVKDNRRKNKRKTESSKDMKHLRREQERSQSGEASASSQPVDYEAKLQKSLDLADQVATDLFSTFYKGERVYDLWKFIRIVFIHWIRLDWVVKLEICPSLAIVDQGEPTSLSLLEAPEAIRKEFLSYWTTRFPGLLTTVYVYALRNKISGLFGGLNQHHFNKKLLITKLNDDNKQKRKVVNEFQNKPYRELESIGDVPQFTMDESIPFVKPIYKNYFAKGQDPTTSYPLLPPKLTEYGLVAEQSYENYIPSAAVEYFEWTD